MCLFKTPATLLAATALLLSSAPLEGQLRPGIERGDYWGEVRARYRSEVLVDVGAVMEAWLEGWNNNDVDVVMESLADDAVLILDSNAVSGEDNLRAALARALPTLGPIQTGLQDFDVSGDMAFATTTFRYMANPGRPGQRQVSGHLVWVLVKHTGAWRIRTQVFKKNIP